MHWYAEGRDEKEWDRLRSKLEVPPPNYAGSLAGTAWDPELVLAGYEQQ